MSLLQKTLAGQVALSAFSPRDWNQLMTEGRQANMMARLAIVLVGQAGEQELPRTVRDVLDGSIAYVDYLQVRARFELQRVSRIAQDCAYPVIALKGAAYLLTGIDAAGGRSLSDLDVMVPREHLDDFEDKLRYAGWSFSEDVSAYDEYYYRELAHELPPMRHAKSQLELDVHHNILQPTHRFAVDVAPMVQNARPIPGTALHALDPADQILHSATHLTMSDELRGGLRDVHDVVLIYREELAKDPGFSQALVERAVQLQLGRPLFYVLDFAERHLGLNLPPETARRLREAAPPQPVLALMRQLLDRRLAPEGHNPGDGSLTEFLLYLRSHWIRMPPALLARHLLRKARQRNSST